MIQKLGPAPRERAMIREPELRFHVEPTLERVSRETSRMISFRRYSALLALPHLKATIFASVLGRFPIGIAGLSILLLSRDATGSFAQAGGTSAAYVVGLASAAPLLGRHIDRRGPRAVLMFCAALYPATLAALVAALSFPMPFLACASLAAAAGASFPPITACMRTLLKRRLANESLLATAYSLEAVLIETVFIAGPMLVAAFVALASAAWAVGFAALCGTVGTLLFLRAPGLADWHIESRRSASLLGALGEPRFLRLLAVVLCYSTAFGLVEIGVTAFAAEAGVTALAGLLLGMMSVGSVLGGLSYGSRTWRVPLELQFALVLGLMGGGIAPLALVDSVWIFAGLCMVAGVVMAPALTIQSMLVAKSAKPEYFAEAFTWSATGLLAGVGLGLAGGGLLLASGTSVLVLAAAAASSFAAALLARCQIRA